MNKKVICKFETKYVKLIISLLLLTASFVSNVIASDYYIAIEDRVEKAITSNNPQKSIKKLRNEIFAKHGRKFKTPELNEYFRSKDWYNVNENYHDSLLSKKEKNLINEFVNLENFFKGENDAKVVFKIENEEDVELDQIGPCTKSHGINIHVSNTSIGKILMYEEYSHTFGGAFEGSISRIYLTVYLVTPQGILEEKWELFLDENEVSTHGDFLIVKTFGCCGSTDDSKFYNLCTGKLITDFTLNYLYFSSNSSEEQRILCFSDIFNSPLKSKFKDDKNVLGFLQLVSPDSIIDQVSISVTNNSTHRLEYCEPIIEKNTDSEKTKNINMLSNNDVIEFTLDCYSKKIKIPLSKNKIIIEGLKNLYLEFKRF